MSTNEHLDAIDDAVSDIETWPDDRGVVTVRAETIRKHAKALATEVRREFDIGSSYHERWVRAKTELEAERARNNALREAFRALAISTMPSAEDEEDGWLFAVADDHGVIEEYFERIDDEEATR